MEQRILVFGAAHLPQLTALLFILLIVTFVFLLIRERSRSSREVTRQSQLSLVTDIERISADAVRTNDLARQHLANLTSLEAAAKDRATVFHQELTSSKQELDQLLAEARTVSQQIAKLAPARDSEEWTSPEALLRLAREADDWSHVAGYLARIKPDAATSKNLEDAANICRDQGFLLKAIELYREAATRDPENTSARAELLALSAEIRATERDQSLRELQDLASQTLIAGTNGVHIQNRFFTTLTDLGRHSELIAFCEDLLRQPLSPLAQRTLHRNLAVFYRSVDNEDASLEQCEAALKLLDDDPAVLSLYSRLLFEAKKYDEAYRIAVRSLQRDPTSARSYMTLAAVQEKRIGRTAARDLLDKAVRWADAAELVEIEGHLRRLTALDELSEILPSTHPQLIQA